MHPNFFVNTPDILNGFLQTGGPGAFRIRAILASMLSPTWGVYSGYELYEHLPVRPGSEEYLDSEKYQLQPRDYAAAEADGRSLAPSPHPAERDPPAASRPALARQPSFPPGRQRLDHGIQQAGRSDRRRTGGHDLGRLLDRPPQRSRGLDRRSTCPHWGPAGTNGSPSTTCLPAPSGSGASSTMYGLTRTGARRTFSRFDCHSWGESDS